MEETIEYSNYDIEQAERYIEELNQSILAASTINNITQTELNTLSKIYKTYLDIVYYGGVKITFIQHKERVFQLDCKRHRNFKTQIN